MNWIPLLTDGLPLAERIQYEIEAMILSGVWEPGAHIREQALATQLGTSRGPVREAFRSLERSGLVDIVPNRGVFVRKSTFRDILETFDIRAQLALLAGQEAAQNVSPKFTSQLYALIDEMDAVTAHHNGDEYLQLNLRFHEKLYELCDNSKLRALDRELGRSISIYRRRGLVSGGGIQVSNQEHRQIVTVLMTGDSENTGQIFRQHVLNGKARFEKAFACACADADKASCD